MKLCLLSEKNYCKKYFKDDGELLHTFFIQIYHLNENEARRENYKLFECVLARNINIFGNSWVN